MPIRTRRLAVAAALLAGVALFVLSPIDHGAWSVVRRVAIAGMFCHCVVHLLASERLGGALGLASGFNRRACSDLEDRVAELEALLDVHERLVLADLRPDVEDLFRQVP
jgi:hypothetical protein